jgi:hypothetical protein
MAIQAAEGSKLTFVTKARSSVNQPTFRYAAQEVATEDITLKDGTKLPGCRITVVKGRRSFRAACFFSTENANAKYDVISVSEIGSNELLTTICEVKNTPESPTCTLVIEGVEP